MVRSSCLTAPRPPRLILPSASSPASSGLRRQAQPDLRRTLKALLLLQLEKGHGFVLVDVGFFNKLDSGHLEYTLPQSGAVIRS